MLNSEGYDMLVRHQEVTNKQRAQYSLPWLVDMGEMGQSRRLSCIQCHGRVWLIQ